LERLVLRTSSDVVRALLTYTDWWQPSTSSVMQVGAARRVGTGFVDGLPSGLLSTIDVRTELCRRMVQLGERDREVLFLWYVQQLAVGDIARAVRVSRRHCFRLRSAAIRKLVELGESEQAA
jgi:DNA-directed RNA polymerase specialized sigma24 family protein